MSDELVRVRDLKKIFSVPAGELHAVDGVDFSIARGSTIGIVGESGCGKSTMGRLLAMLLEATSGEILFDGQNIAKKMSKAEAMAYKKRIQMIFQDPFSSLNPRMTTFETIIEPLNIHRAGTLQEREARVYQLMETVGLSERFVNAYPHELDGGRRQRIGIARALAVNPKFIVCDEPVSALDVSIQAQVINMFEELQEKLGVAYLFIAHDLLVVRHISDRIAVMYLGKMVELADAAEIYDHPLHPYSQSLLSAVPVPDPKVARANKRIVLTGDIPSPLNAPSGCPFRTRCRYATEQCAAEMPEFKEVSKGHFVACHRTAEINS